MTAPKAEIIKESAPTKGKVEGKDIFDLSKNDRDKLKNEIKKPTESDEMKEKSENVAYKIAKLCNEKIKAEGPQGCKDIYWGFINTCIKFGLYTPENSEGKNKGKDLTAKQKEDNNNIELYTQVLIMSILQDRTTYDVQLGKGPTLSSNPTKNYAPHGKNKDNMNQWAEVTKNSESQKAFLTNLGIKTDEDVDQVLDGIKKTGKPSKPKGEPKKEPEDKYTPPERNDVSSFLREKPLVVAGGAAALAFIGWLIFRKKDAPSSPTGAPSGSGDHGFGLNLWHILLAAGLGFGGYYGYKEIQKLNKKLDVVKDIANGAKDKYDESVDKVKKEFDRLKKELEGKKTEEAKKAKEIVRTVTPEMKEYIESKVKNLPISEWDRTLEPKNIAEIIVKQGPLEALRTLKRLSTSPKTAIIAAVAILTEMIAMERAIGEIKPENNKKTDGTEIKTVQVNDLYEDLFPIDTKLNDVLNVPNIQPKAITDEIEKIITKKTFDKSTNKEILKPLIQKAIAEICLKKIEPLASKIKKGGTVLNETDDMFKELYPAGPNHSLSWLKEVFEALKTGEQNSQETNETLKKIVNGDKLNFDTTNDTTSLTHDEEEDITKAINLIDWLKLNF